MKLGFAVCSTALFAFLRGQNLSISQSLSLGDEEGHWLTPGMYSANFIRYTLPMPAPMMLKPAST